MTITSTLPTDMDEAASPRDDVNAFQRHALPPKLAANIAADLGMPAFNPAKPLALSGKLIDDTDLNGSEKLPEPKPIGNVVPIRGSRPIDELRRHVLEHEDQDN